MSTVIYKPDIIGWIAAWIIVPMYAIVVCPILLAAEIYEDILYGEKVEI